MARKPAKKAQTDTAQMRVRFLREVPNFTPPEKRGVTWHFYEGQEQTVRRTHGEAMVASGDAVEIEVPARETD